MSVTSVSGETLKQMFLSGSNNLTKNKKAVNDLNVFPVPDGDTGTNMSMTVESAIQQVAKVTDGSIDAIVEALALGSLMGARGNSGVILSQLFRGFAKALKGKTEITIPDFAEALSSGVTVAYKAVMKPVEGTILTVSRMAAEKAMEIKDTTADMAEFLEIVIEAAKEALDKTPELLSVLKQAGVVDAGGKGFIYILEGAYLQVIGQPVGSVKETEGPAQEKAKSYQSSFQTEDITYGYCTEVLLENKTGSVEAIQKKFKDLGDSMIVVGAGDIIKIHIHTNRPDIVLKTCLEYGDLQKIKIDNMREQHKEILGLREAEAAKEPETKEDDPEDPKEEKEIGILAVCSGDGIEEIFRSLGVDYVVKGGQTMNPSTEDLAKGVEKICAKNVIILPNNGNIILAAEQTKEVSDKHVEVIPSKTVPQGITAVMNFLPDMKLEDLIENMKESLSTVKSGQLTYAVRDSKIDGVDVSEGDVIGLFDGKLVCSGKDLSEVTLSLLENMIDEDSCMISVFYGDDVTEEQADADKKMVEETYPDVDVEFHWGGQPVYRYLISVE